VSLSSTTLIAQTDYKDLGVKVDSIFLASLGEQTPGASVAITLNGELILSRQYGMANLEHKIPITQETKLHLVSGSKQFTAFGILKLEKQGHLSLNDEVHKYLPELYDFGTPITIKHLLAHTSGLRQDTHIERIIGYWKGQIMTQSRALELIFSQQEINFEPGSKFNYSNSGYTLLAEVIERITKQSFQKWMQENVFLPIGMHQTIISDHYTKIIPTRAEAYGENDKGYYRESGGLWQFYGGVGIYSTAIDISRWLSFLDSPAEDYSEIVSRMQQQTILNNGDTIHWGLGLTINEGVGGEERIWHAGDGPGYHAWIGRYPNQGLGIVILTNLNSFHPEFAADEIAELFIPKIEPAGSEFSVPNDKFESTVIDELVGWYEVNPEPIWYINQGLWEFWQEGDSLFFAPDAGTKIALHAISDSTFYIENDPVLISFYRNKMGVFDALTLTAPEGKQTARKITDSSFKFQPSKAQELTGKYYSPELKTEYEIFISDHKVMVRHNSPQVNRRWYDFSLKAINQDYFISDKDFFTYVQFERNSEGEVIGLRVTNKLQRVVNLWFEKI
jgi:CubicO group peptidase (beta-lactamase class C family)